MSDDFLSNDGFLMCGEDKVRLARIRTLMSGIDLETAGFKRRGKSCAAIVRSEFGFRGSREEILEQLTNYYNGQLRKLTNEKVSRVNFMKEVPDRLNDEELAYWNGCGDQIVNEMFCLALKRGIDEAVAEIKELAKPAPQGD